MFKRILAIFLAIFSLFALVSCGGADDNKLVKEITAILGEIKELPIDIDAAVENIGKEATKFTPKDESSGDGAAVIDNAIVYKTSREVTDKTSEGKDISYVINTLHFGKLISETKQGNVAFVSANLTLEVTSDDKEYAKNYLLSLLDTAPVDATSKALYIKLINGEQISINNDSYLWNEFIDLDERMKIVFDNEAGTFDVKFIGEVGVLYHDQIRDENDMLLKDTAYYFDDEGNKYIEEILEHSYFENKSYTKGTYYYYMTHTLKEMSEGYMEFTSTETGGSTRFVLIYEIKYYENGSLESEYYNHNPGGEVANYTRRSFYENGQLANEEIANESGLVRKGYDEEGNLLYHEEEYQNGNAKYTMGYVDEELGDISYMAAVEQFFDENGNITKQIKDDPIFSVKRINEYREDGSCKRYAVVNYDGEVVEETFYDESGNEI